MLTMMILDQPYWILIIWWSGSLKIKALLNLLKQQKHDNYNVIDKIYLYVKGLNETKYQYLLKKYGEICLEEC